MIGHHHIDRQQLILEAPGLLPAQAGGWYDRLRDLQKNTILPIIEQQLDLVENSPEDIVIPKLEVTIEVSDLEKLADGFGPKLEEYFAKAIRAAVQSSRTKEEDGGLFLTAFRYYLRSGNLIGRYADPKVFRKALVDWLRTADEEVLRSFLPLLEADLPAFLGRAAQVQKAFLAQCWLALLAEANIEPGSSPTSGSVPTDPKIWAAYLEMAGYRPHKSTTQSASPEEERRPAQEVKKSPELEDGTSFYPENAGIVLLHPYLRHLLEEVGCRVRKNDPKALGRAATLFHYAVFGHTKVEEWDLPLTKLLLGIGPEELLLPARKLREEDKIAVDELLDGIIGHWKALKGTSRDGLREGFLQRSGKLVFSAESWRLTVEQQPHDLLLDSLPWNISIVKTPWMDTLLKVDWA